MPIRTFLIASMILAAAGCKPTFEPTGTMSIGGAPFHPTACHVLTCETGVELIDPNRGRLELTLPPQPLKAWQTIGGGASARWIAGSNSAPVGLGACASLTMRGEGYHGSGRRAASGHASLSCTGAVAAAGTLDFSGCF
jgi:hypothetical protein